MRNSLALLLLLSLFYAASAYGPITKQYIAESILLTYYPSECKERIDEGASYPDFVLNDTHRRFCVDALQGCPAIDGKYCRQTLSCPAWEEGANWRLIAKGKHGCEQAFALAVASAYYADAHDPTNNIVNADECREQLSQQLESAVASKAPKFRIEVCCNILRSNKCVFTEQTLRELIDIVRGGVISEGFPFNASNVGNRGCYYKNPPCNENETCRLNECIAKVGCAYNNPPCPPNHYCENNTCMKYLGCAYNSPACDENHTCINNICVLKEGCSYGNPPCPYGSECINNICVRLHGCAYDNPPCASNEECINNICVLKEGCAYNNPPCPSGKSCVNNQCVDGGVGDGKKEGGRACPLTVSILLLLFFLQIYTR
ncbi:MAG: hypothetical protein QXP42_00335 [Candidatus Micrarchaeia archaeon]